MEKHTPQKWADLTGCYVARDKNRRCFTVYANKPIPNYKEGWWSNLDGDYGELPTAAVPEKYYSDDWTTLYEPHNKSEANSQNQPEVDNKAPHQSEVHVEKEYVLLCEFQPNALMQKVNELLKDGFKLYGNPWTGPDPTYGQTIHYQAMVRGV